MTTLKERFEENLPYENTFVDSEAQQATLTFIRQELMLLADETDRKAKRLPSVFTTQGFTTPECKSCGDGFSWHNGNPPPVCKECAEKYIVNSYNEGLEEAATIIRTRADETI